MPGRPQARSTHAVWLKQYVPMVEEGTWAWIEVGQSNLFKNRLPAHLVASVFANREIYLVMANYGRTALEVDTAVPYLQPAETPSRAQTHWRLEPRSLVILKSQTSDVG